jgi:uncharacterized protein YcbK (DUF882 family)
VNLTSVITARSNASRTDTTTRADTSSSADAAARAARADRADRADRTERSDRPDRPSRTERRARSTRAAHADDDTSVTEPRKPTRAEFAAMLALLSGAGDSVRADLLKQVPDGNASLIDSLLAGDDEALSLLETEGLTGSVGDATDALRYGILKESRGAEPLLANALSAGGTNGAAPGGGASVREIARGLINSDEHSRAREVLSRIVSRRGASADQLKALGDNAAADVRVALDALLARAGTPSALALAGASEGDKNEATTAAAAAAATAAATALAQANAASAADVTTPVRDTSALVPELRQRLDRVIERMKNEYGHDVTVVETARSQERQDFLYEQGRTRSGAVVTWTRDSAHTQGEAVDVIVDGTWSNAEGFARLQRLAREEGLRTLGVRDPGHLELADRTSTGAQMATDTPSKSAPVATPLISTSSGQAGVARVAGVAGVAQVAEPGRARGLDRSYSPANSNGLAGYAASNAANGAERGPSNNSTGNESSDSSSGQRRALSQVRRESLGGAESAAFGALNGSSSSPTPAGDGVPVIRAAGAASAERVSDVQQLRDNAPAGSVSRLTLDVDAPNGGQDRITIDLRGSNVGTQISTDAANAERLRLRTAELQDALGRHGLESDSVRISGAPRQEAVDAARVVGADRDGLRLNAAQQSGANDGAMQQGQRERAATAREWDRPESSQKQREEQRDAARQGAGQRGQRGTSNGSGS